jgi:hypothetical protein
MTKLSTNLTLDPGDPPNAKVTSKNPSIVSTSAARSTGAATPAHTRVTQATEPWIYRYNTTSFEQLHAILYPIMHELAMDKVNEHSHFTKKWKQVTNRTNLKMNPKMSWKQAQDCLGISDLAQLKISF